MEILKNTIEGNDILKERLYPDSKDKSGAWASTNIVCRNGARLTCKGFGSSVRGAHPYWIVVDDGLKDNVIYSQLQRQKSIDYFHSVIMNMLVPGGQIIVVGTPFHASDLYGDLKSKSIHATGNKKGWFVIEYPAIFPNGRLLAPDRFTFDKLMQERESAGSLVFSREYLVVPISDDSTIFPWEFLKRSIVGMENVRLVDNIESYPVKLKRVVCGCDFAESGTVGADFTVYTVWGKGVDDCYYLLYIYRAKGLSHNEQVMKICQIDQQFRPNEIVVEDNGFQKILADMARQRGLRNIHEFTTTAGNKKDLRTGWPSLAALFERGAIRCPYHPDTRDRVDTMFGEFNSVAFRSDVGKLESISGHDDCVSSSFMAINRLREGATVKIDAV